VDEEYAEGHTLRHPHRPWTLIFAFAVGLVGMSGFYGNAIVALVEVKSLRALSRSVPETA